MEQPGMYVKVLGARQGESLGSHFVSLLVDGVLALDAGSLTSGLTLQEQARIQGILLTHRHYDHIKDLATFGFNRLGRGQVGIYCTPEVKRALEDTILSDGIWLNFFTLPTPEMPTFVYTPVEPNRALTLAGYRVRPMPVRHSVPALGYEVTCPGGSTLVYSGDSGPGSGAAWASSMPDLLIAEVTYPDADTALAAKHGHLSPGLFAKELQSFRDLRGTLPKIAVVHVNPFYDTQIAIEIAAVARSLSADIWLPDEGSVIEVRRMP